jgi:hypothetical protein
MSITQLYIDEHSGVHTFDSWGRAIFEQALNEARKKVGNKSANVVELDAKVIISPVGTLRKPKFCISVTVEFGNGPVTAAWHGREK